MAIIKESIISCERSDLCQINLVRVPRTFTSVAIRDSLGSNKRKKCVWELL